MRIHLITLKIWAVLAFMLAPGAVLAQTEPAVQDGGVVNVGVYLSPPFIMKDGDLYTGMAAELWQAVSARSDLASKFVEFDTPRALIDATANGEIDVAVTNLSITKDRAQRIDFTQPWYDSGLRIMVNETGGNGLDDLFHGLRDSGYLRSYVWLTLVIIAATFLLTLFDRRFDKEFPRTWGAGLTESFYHVMSIATSGKTSRKKMFGSFGRFFAAIWLVCGVAVLAYVTSSVTSVMTAAAISNQINEAEDLPGREIGVFAGSVGEEHMRAEDLRTRPYNNIEEAAEALRTRRIDAIVADAPVLEYYANSAAGSGLDVVGPIFMPDKYGFATPLDSNLGRLITLNLLGAREDGTVERLRTKYFGDDM
ncbi:transporter substrate-binding domain-containing protein [Mariluticola halotolerans]|uniref:transporter substrate-binding domain-containing protein n=1 Tax=Mariluticola halotolerans TaxID=2909283 RepID=UPI0026E428D9|nr:transporter substrate-binding domain-containing protein [Mariluticola halotolerans]UJQ94489.1 transporter substrate-binding domain-containing protein [Mariluticola halotolerans]